MEAVKKLRNEGNGWRTIAKELGIASHTTIRNRLKVLNNTPLQPTDGESVENHPVL